MPGPTGAMGAGALAFAMKGGISSYRNTNSTTSFQLNEGVTGKQIYDTSMNGGDMSNMGQNVTTTPGFGTKLGHGALGTMGGAMKGAAIGGAVYGAAHMAMKHQDRLSRWGSSGVVMANRGFSKIKGLFR